MFLLNLYLIRHHFFAPPTDKLSSDNILSELSSSESDRRLNGLSSSDSKLGDFLLLFFVV